MTTEPQPLTAEEEAEIRARVDAANTGPWLYRPAENDDWGLVRMAPDSTFGFPGCVVANARSGDDVIDCDGCRTSKTDPYERNGRFIAHARTDIPRLLATITAERSQLTALDDEFQEALQLSGLRRCDLDAERQRAHVAEANAEGYKAQSEIYASQLAAERSRAARLTKALSDLGEIARKINDTVDRSEGDRYYLGSTNDWDDLHEVLHRHAGVFLEAFEGGSNQ